MNADSKSELLEIIGKQNAEIGNLARDKAALLEAAKRIVLKNDRERMIGSETAEDREALKQAIAQAERRP